MRTRSKSYIVGTAGHIDHGKSTLVQALTGTHPDRLEEEKRRGITIDLGFAFLEEEGVRFGFVDVPGHERFVKNMLAGASGIDIVLLVIAAVEAIRPQTREHFDICRLLGVKRGIVVLTKSDLVDVDTLDLVKLEVEEFVQGTFLAGAPILPVSAKTGVGLAELKKALHTAAQQIPEKDSARYFRLPIDRSFAVKGFGTVVTGTLISGHVASEDEVELLPEGGRLRVRGLQTGGKAVQRAEAGQRTAINLAGIEHGSIQRGMVLATPGSVRPTRRLDVRLELLGLAEKLKHRARVHFHIGTAETVGEVLLYDGVELLARQNALAHIRLDREVVARPGDRFIVRQYSPVITIGGGAVIDPLARRPAKKDEGRTKFLQMLENGSREAVLAAIAERNILGVTEQEIVGRTGWLATEVRAAVDAATASKRVRAVSEEPTITLAGGLFTEITEKLWQRVEKFHKENPLSAGMQREDLRASLGRRVRPETFRAALEELIQQKKLVAQGELVKKPGSEITMTAEELQAKLQIEQAFARAGLTVPSLKEVLAQLSIENRRAEKILQILLRDKVVVRVSPELIFHASALERLPEMLKAYKRSKGEKIGVPEFKAVTGVTRKYAIPLLEYLDRQRITRRVGDERVIL